jgi:hypothetical protein
VVTLAMISGTIDQWKPVVDGWREALKINGAKWLHTTDAVSMSDPYSKRDGWDVPRRDKLINDCLTAIEPLMVRKKRNNESSRYGVYPCTVSVVLPDHIRARSALENIPKNANEICSIQALHRCLEWGRDIVGADFYHLIFDQGEPFRGHIEDRRVSKKAVREFPVLGRITAVTDADMRNVPALQIADLFAWCVSHKKENKKYSWQRRVLNIDRMDDWINEPHLMNPIARTMELMKEWKLPRRRPNR